MLVAAAILASVALVQPEPSDIDAAQRVSEAYESASFAERASVVFTDNDDEPTEFETVIRLGTFDDVLHASLELPGLRLHFVEGVLTAERTGEPNKAVVFRVEDAGEGFLSAIAPHVPVMPMPQLWRFDEKGRCTDPAFGAIVVVGFDEADSTLTVSTQAGEAELVIDPASSRAVSLDAPLGDGRFHATYEHIEPGEVSSWTIPTEGRWIVTRLAQLTPPRSPIERGLQLEDLNLARPNYEGWKLSEIQGDEYVRRAGPWVVLLMCRADAEDETFELAGEVAAELWHAAAEEVATRDPEDADRYWFGHRSIVVAVSGELEVLPEQMRALAARSPKGVPLLVSTEPRRTIDRLTIPAPLTAILVDPQRKVGAVVPIEIAETGVSAVMDAMRSFVRRDEPEPATASDSGE